MFQAYHSSRQSTAVYGMERQKLGDSGRLLSGRRDDSGFERLYSKHETLLRRIACMICGDPCLAEDLLQETWIRAWRAIDSLKEPAAAKGWLITILKREYARYLSRKRLNLVPFDDCRCGKSSEAPPEQGIYLNQLLSSLTEGERQPLLMHLIEGHTISQIASRWQTSNNAIRIRLHRTRKRLSEEGVRESAA